MYQHSVGGKDTLENKIFMCSINISLVVCQRTHILNNF